MVYVYANAVYNNHYPLGLGISSKEFDTITDPNHQFYMYIYNDQVEFKYLNFITQIKANTTIYLWVCYNVTEFIEPDDVRLSALFFPFKFEQ